MRYMKGLCNWKEGMHGEKKNQADSKAAEAKST